MAELKLDLYFFGVASCAQSADSSSRQNITNRTEFLSSAAFSLITTFITSCERFFTFRRQSRECGLMFGGCAAVLTRSSKTTPGWVFLDVPSLFLLSFFPFSSLFSLSRVAEKNRFCIFYMYYYTSNETPHHDTCTLDSAASSSTLRFYLLRVRNERRVFLVVAK